MVFCFVTLHYYKQVLATASSCLICVCAGMTFGISAVMLPQLREDQTILYTPGHESWIASISNLALILGSLFCGTMLDSCGRKVSLLVLCIPFIFGWIVIACANSTSIILVGRFVTGLSTGGMKLVTLVYIGEIVDPNLRAVALFLPGLAAHIGILVSHIIGYYIPWKTCAFICIFPPILSLLIFLFLKESPLWLITKGRKEEGIETFRWFRGKSDEAEAELKAILDKQSAKPKLSIREALEIMSTKGFIAPMLVLVVVLINSNLSGVIVIVFYSIDMFNRAFTGTVDPFILTIVMDCFRTAGSVVICGLGNVVPKKLAFVVSSFAASLFVFGFVSCSLAGYNGVWLPVVCLILYICFSSAIVTISWTLPPELLPGRARGVGTGIYSALSFILLFAIVKTTPAFMDSYGEAALFAFFGTSLFVCGIILCFILPETSGKTLQSIEDDYQKKKIKEQA